MNKHICSKEKEISDINVGLATVKNDINWTKNNIEEISSKLDRLITSVNDIKSDFNRINKDVYGNGVKGIKEKVSNHDDYIVSQQGMLKVIIWFLGVTQPLIISVLGWIITNKP